MERRFDAHGYTITVASDTDPANPRHIFEPAGRMVCWHRRYALGDPHAFAGPEDFAQWWATHGTGGVLLPLYLYDHSGLTVSTTPFSCRWDSGQVGWVYLTAADVASEFADVPDARARATALLVAEVEDYDRYLTGDVWAYTLIDGDGDIIDSCAGYHGEEVAREAAVAAAASCTRLPGHQLPLPLADGPIRNGVE